MYTFKNKWIQWCLWYTSQSEKSSFLSHCLKYEFYCSTLIECASIYIENIRAIKPCSITKFCFLIWSITLSNRLGLRAVLTYKFRGEQVNTVEKPRCLNNITHFSYQRMFRVLYSWGRKIKIQCILCPFAQIYFSKVFWTNLKMWNSNLMQKTNIKIRHFQTIGINSSSFIFLAQIQYLQFLVLLARK